jgi:hypothetical protein
MLLSHHGAAARDVGRTVRPVAVDEVIPDASPGPLLDEEKVHYVVSAPGLATLFAAPAMIWNAASGPRPRTTRLTLVALRL